MHTSIGLFRTLLASTALLSTALISSALASPQLRPQQISGITLAVPVGWAVKTSASPVPTIRLEAPPGAADSPSVLLMSMPQKAGGPSIAQIAGQLVQSTMKPAQQLGQQQAPNGAMLTLWQGPIGGIPAKMAVMHQAANSVGMVAAFAAPVAKFDALGGPQLLMAILAGQGSAAGPGRPAPQAAAPAGALQVPAAYARSNMPVLNYLADAFETLQPAQFAAGLRQMNATEHQTLSIYSAFGNLVHYMACQADRSIRQANGQTCMQTHVQWQQTLQFSNNDVRQATMEAQSQRSKIQVAARCGDGRNDASTCQMYMKTQGAMNTANHNNMMRIISNMSANGCIVGDPGCVPY
jgi:hypothetical protein